MSDYIDRQAAIDAIEELILPNPKGAVAEGINSFVWRCAINCAEERIGHLPSIEPVKHGRWIIKDNPGTGWYRVTCSECGEDVTSVAPVIGFFPNAKVIWDYCPDCGAKMDREGAEA